MASQSVSSPALTSATGPLLRRLIRSYLRPHYGLLAISILFMILASATTGALAKLMEPVIDEVFRAKDRAGLYGVAVAIMVTFVLRGIATYGHTVLMNRIGQRIVATIQQQLFAHLVKADLAFFHNTPAGQLISRMINDVGVMRTAVAECLTGLGRSALTLMFLIGLMFWQDWRMAIAAFIVFPAAAAFVAQLGKRMRRLSAKTQAELGSFSSLLNQVFQGMRHVKAYGMENYEAARVGQTTERLFSLVHKTFRVSASSAPVTEALSGLAIVVVIVYGGSQVIDGHRTAGQLFSFITAFMLAYEPIKRMAKVNGQLQAGLAAAERVFHLLDMKPALPDAPDAKPLDVPQYDIQFSHVAFGYQGADELALNDLTLHVPSGKTVALVGSSGAGKSTVLNLIPRFYDVTAGCVTVGGVDVRTVTAESLRSKISLVSQDVILFDDTIRANIAYGLAGATEAQIVEAARTAAAHDFISALPLGYDTPVGELGVKLSGGQRQRIAIARAMLRNAPILLLDEATSALDTESERAVQDALKILQKGRTTLLIAHRLSTVVDADCICVLDKGRVIEAGTHTELLAQGGAYSRLYGHQR